MARALLTEDQIEQALGEVEWDRDGDRIEKKVVLADFRAAMAFVNHVADAANRLDHHPDITISWNKVGLSVSTHDSGGLTASDFDLARAVDALGSDGEGAETPDDTDFSP